MAASHMGHLDVVKLLLSHPGVDVNALDHVRRLGANCLFMAFITRLFLYIQNGRTTALMKAAHMGHLEIVKLLLAYPSVDVNAQDKVSFTGNKLSFGLLYKQNCFVCIEWAYDSPYESFFNESSGYC